MSQSQLPSCHLQRHFTEASAIILLVCVIEFLINNSYVLYANYFYLSIFLLCRLLRNFYC